MSTPPTLSIRRPDDWHVHLRDGPLLAACAVHTARQFARGIIMPNLVPPVTKVAEAAAYRERIRRAVPAGLAFEPLRADDAPAYFTVFLVGHVVIAGVLFTEQLWHPAMWVQTRSRNCWRRNAKSSLRYLK